MDEQELQEIMLALGSSTVPPPPELRLYYDSEGKVVTYTCEHLPGNYILVTPQQFAEARPDVIVREGKILYTHRRSHIQKLVKNTGLGTRTSKYDVNILVTDTQEHVFWNLEIYEITGTHN